MRGAFQLLQIWQAKRNIDKQKQLVALQIADKPGQCRRWWISFKAKFYRCFVHCEPDEHPYGLLDQIWYDGTEPNDHLKLILGYLGTLVMATLLCIFFIFKHPWSPRFVGVACGVLAMAFAYLMFFRLPRCWFLLMMPELLSSRARAILILVIVSWTLVGPALNAQINLKNTAEMMACLQEQVGQEGSSIKSVAKNNLKARFERFFEAKRHIEEVMKTAKDSLKSVYTSLVRMGNVIRRLSEWLDSLVKYCNDEAMVPYRNCVTRVEELYEKCKAATWFVFCYIFEAIRYLGCNWLQSAKLLCNLPAYMVSIIKEQILERIKKNLESAMEKLEETFEYKVEMHRNFSYHEKFESNMTYFRNEAERHMQNVKWWFEMASTIMDILMWVTLIFMFFKAVLYQRKYKRNVRFDNYFVNQYLAEIDSDRMKLNKEIALPLTRGESCRFIKASSIWLATIEKWKIMIPLFTTTSTLIFVAFWIGFDFAIFVSMTEQYIMLIQEGGVDVPNYFKIHVQGKGMFADAFRKVLNAFMPQNFDSEDLSKKWQTCITEPSVPDFKLYEYLYIMIAICYLTILLQIYLARLRHKICSVFYPYQERKRAIELHSQILVARGSWIYFAQKQMSNRKEAVQKTMERVAVSVPFLGKAIRLFGDKTKMCFECHDRIKVEDVENFRQCDIPTCNQTFCTECFYRCSTCQSCGGEKVPKGLFVDYEMPDPLKQQQKKKTKDECSNEELIIRYYGDSSALIRTVDEGGSPGQSPSGGSTAGSQTTKTRKSKKSKTYPRVLVVKRYIHSSTSANRKLAKKAAKSSKRSKRTAPRSSVKYAKSATPSKRRRQSRSPTPKQHHYESAPPPVKRVRIMKLSAAPSSPILSRCGRPPKRGTGLRR